MPAFDPVNLTVLRLSGVGVPPYSARGLQQSLTPIDQASVLRRTINGILVDLSFGQFQKYRSTITGNDQMPPAVDGVWPGQQVIVDCIPELCYVTAGGSAAKDVVSGSDHVVGDFTFYRPRLTMIVTAFSTQTNEYDAVVGWTMDLEER